MMKWQPIDTAPKDGTHILAYWPENVFGNLNPAQVETWFGPIDSKYNDDMHWQSLFDWGGYGYDPTHWMPLPEPPSNKEGEE